MDTKTNTITFIIHIKSTTSQRSLHLLLTTGTFPITFIIKCTAFLQNMFCLNNNFCSFVVNALLKKLPLLGSNFPPFSPQKVYMNVIWKKKLFNM